MKRIIADFSVALFAAAFIALLAAAGCHRELKVAEKVDTSSSFELDAGLRIDDQVAQKVALDQHQIVTAGPVEQVREDLAPDGGVVTRTVTRWGGSTSEDWLKQETGRDEHVHLEAQKTVSAKGDEHATKVLDKESDGGGFGWGLKIGAALVLVVLAGAGYAAYRLNLLRKAVSP